MRVRIAPGWGAAMWRSLLLTCALLLIAAGVYAMDGAPTLSRKSRFNEFERFAPSFGNGLADATGELLVLIGVTWFCRLGLKIRLEAEEDLPRTRFEQASGES